MRTPTILVAIAATCGRPPDPVPRHDAAALEIPIGARAAEIATGDLDGDGRLDLVTADGEDRTISVRLQRDGGWKAATSIATELEPHLVALGDLDGDRDLDVVATAHDSPAAHVWLGDGRGAFTAATGSPFAAFAGKRPHNHGLAVGDLDGDGDDDVVVADQEQNAAAVLLADGRGALRRRSTIALTAAPYPPALGDLDGDGRLDLVVPLIGGSALAVLLGDGRGGFVAAYGSPQRTARERPYGVALGDLDGDGALDAIVAHDDTDDVSVLLGDGKGRLRDAPGSPVSIGRRIWRPAIADVDGDGRLDLVGAGSGSLVVAPGDGRGGLGRPQVEPLDGWRVAAVDLDGDGRIDLVAPDAEARVVRVWLGSR